MLPDQSAPSNLGALHDEAAALTPDRVALVDGERDEAVTYGELAERVATAGNALADLEVERGDRVALFFPNELDYLYAFLGAIRLGAVPVPVNIQVPMETLSYVVADADPSLVVSSAAPDVLDGAAAVADENGYPLAVNAEEPDGPGDVRSYAAAFADASPELDPASVSSDDPAIQPYTSGSTGRPKGVVLTHGGAIWNAIAKREAHLFTREERGLIAAPMYHKNAMVTAIKPLLSAGGSVVVLDGFDAERVIAAVDRYDVTYLTGVPAMFTMLVNADATADHDVSSVEWAVCGSDTVPETLHEEFAETFDAVMLEEYGITEGGPAVAASPRWGPRKLGSAGLALPGCETRVVDPDTNEGLPPGETGELIVSNPGLGRYHGLPEKEDEAFEERDGKRFLHTDDLVYKDEQGYHYVVGRLDDMLIVGGENVYPAEVENLLKKHDAVGEVAVVGAPHAVKGEAPVAFVVAGREVTEAELKEFALERGPAYAHPRRVFFLDELPLTGTEKVDRDALRDGARERIDGTL